MKAIIQLIKAKERFSIWNEPQTYGKNNKKMANDWMRSFR